MQAPPKAVIYVVRGQGVSQTLKKMRESLGTMQIPSIENVDITRDLLRQDAVRKVSGNKDFPIVFVDDVLIGDVDDLEAYAAEKLNSNEKRESDSWEDEEPAQGPIPVGPKLPQGEVNAIEEVLSPFPKPSEKIPALSPKVIENVQPSRVSKDAIEDTAHKLNSIGQVGGFVEEKVSEWVSWWYSTPPPTVSTDVVNIINQGGTCFTVIHTNWYNRQQVRIVQFGETEFKRFDPKIAEPRATHEYKEIQKLDSFEDGTQEHYETKDRDKISDLFMEGAKKQGKHLVRMFIEKS